MKRTRPIALALVSVFVVAAATTVGRAHDFQETRRLVLSVEERRVELLVVYEVRPSRVADAIRARFDSGDDGIVRTGLERLARAQVVGPRVRHGLSLSVDGRALPLAVERLAFPQAPREGGRAGVAAVALLSARLPAEAWATGSLDVTLRTRGARGRLTLEAQAAPGYEMTAAGLESRPGDPVLGPSALSASGAVALTVAKAPAAR